MHPRLASLLATVFTHAVTVLPLVAEEKEKETEETPRPGHSHAGEAFNEGPRQSGKRIAGTGKVHFPITTSWDQGQAWFDQGLGQLHGFWYYEAERTFREIAAHDPDCAMAYWGMAMANWENEKRAKAFTEKAFALKKTVTKHERLYIQAQANYLDGNPTDAKVRRQELITDIERIIHEFPDDIEAKAFLACRLWQFSRKGMPITSPQAVDTMLDLVFAENPMHPAHHYRIHLWDKPKPERALESAAILGGTAPAIAHMWHMPGHIYSKLKRYDDSAWAQQASARIDHKHMMEWRLLPDRIHNYAHNNEWLARNWINTGQAADALRMAKTLIANPRHPDINVLSKANRSTAYGRQRLLDVLEKFELWDEAIAIAETAWLEPTDDLGHQSKRLRLLGVAHFEKGDRENLQAVLKEIETAVTDAEEKNETAREEARKKAKEEKKKPKEIETAVKNAGKKPGTVVANVKKVQAELKAYDAMLDPDAEKPKELSKDIKRTPYALARLHWQIGAKDKALEVSKKAVDDSPKQVLPLAARIEILHGTGLAEKAKEAFTELQAISARMDRTTPAFRRMDKLAGELGFPAQWQAKPTVADDVGERPDLDSLGPVAWTPPPVPDFALPDQNAIDYTPAQFRGKPTILIFYLGYGCLHCVDQIKLFATNAERIEKAGFHLAAISSDSADDLKFSQSTYAEGGKDFPFLLLADPDLKAFRAYNAYDDFEDEPLHAVYVLDANGRMLWRDIGAEPFMKLDFLLEEAQRLVKLHAVEPLNARVTKPAR